MELVPRVALSAAAVTILALESKKPIARQKALAWLDAYRGFLAAGMPDLQARAAAAEAWDAVPLPDGKPLRRPSVKRVSGIEDEPSWYECPDCNIIWQPILNRGCHRVRGRIHQCRPNVALS